MHRTYVRRRIAAATLVVAVVAIGAPAAARVVREPRTASTTTYVVRPGDTLWSIARRAAPGADPRVVIESIVALNDLGADPLVPGRSLALPAM